MDIKNLNILKNSNVKTRLCALSLAGVMAVTMTGCSNSKSNNSSERQTAISIESTENITYLDGESPEIYKVESLNNGEKRGILLSDEAHLYEAFIEKTKTKVYLSDENGNRLSNNFDELILLSNYSYYTNGGIALGTYTKVETDKQYDYFVGITLRKDSNGSSLGPSITLLDNNGLELCTFNGELKALVENTAVIRDYFEGEDRMLGAPDTYLYDYITEKKSIKYDTVKIFKCECEQNEEITYLIGLDFYRDNSDRLKCLYSFYDRNMNVVAIVSENEIEDWYINNNDMDSFYKAGGDYYDYFKTIYDKKNIEQASGPILTKTPNN